MKKIAVFASGAGSNTATIINYFKDHDTISVALVASNKPDAGVLSIASENNIPVLVIEKEKFFRGDAYMDEIYNAGIDFIVLAGFLWKIPVSMVKAFPGKIINIHPALLPKYGGKGMYGRFVHQAVIHNKEKESGISIHYVDEIYDHGKSILQVTCKVDENDSPETLARKIQLLEHSYYPKVIADVIEKTSS